MKGYPKNLNSKADYLYVMANFPREMWEQDVKDLLKSESDWFFDHELSPSEPGINNETHKVVEDQSMTGEKTRSQYVWKSNPQAKLYELGFTKDEVVKFLI